MNTTMLHDVAANVTLVVGIITIILGGAWGAFELLDRIVNKLVPWNTFFLAVLYYVRDPEGRYRADKRAKEQAYKLKHPPKTVTYTNKEAVED